MVLGLPVPNCLPRRARLASNPDPGIGVAGWPPRRRDAARSQWRSPHGPRHLWRTMRNLRWRRLRKQPVHTTRSMPNGGRRARFCPRRARRGRASRPPSARRTHALRPDGCTGWQERAEDLLRQRGRRWSRGRSDQTVNGAGLSDREEEVLRELRAGRSNAQIAQRMVLSENTVARHLTRI